MIDNAKSQIDIYRESFRGLEDWNISFDPKSEYKGQTLVNPEIKQAVIYAYASEKYFKETPNDYYLHEVIHIAFRATFYSGYSGKVLMEKEEFLVRDLCKMIMVFEKASSWIEQILKLAKIGVNL